MFYLIDHLHCYFCEWLCRYGPNALLFPEISNRVYLCTESLVTETLVTDLIKYNTDESLVTETLVTGLIKYNTDERLVTMFVSVPLLLQTESLSGE
jgi:hypothetical protein